MDLLKIFIVILHIFILTNSYKLICRATKKERFLFICWIFILQSIVEIFFYFVFLHGLGLEKLMFPFIIYVYLIGIKKYDKYKAIFISLLLSLLYHSTHTFLSVTLSSITGDSFVTKYENFFFLVVLLLTYFAIKKLLLIFTLNLIILTKTTSIHFLRKLYLLSLLYMFYHSFQIW